MNRGTRISIAGSGLTGQPRIDWTRWRTILNEPYDPARFDPIRNPGPDRIGTKPLGGLWFSPELSNGETAWSRWCRSERFHKLGRHGYRFKPELGARLFLVESPVDRDMLIQRYALPTSNGVFLRLDWESIAREYDGVYLTARMLEHDLLKPPMAFYGWDCESGVWFKPYGFQLEPWRLFEPIGSDCDEF